MQMGHQERVCAERATGRVGARCRCPLCAVVEQLTGTYYFELNYNKINQAIDKTEFDISKIDLIDKAILYVAFEEIIFGELDHPVVIDEAIRLSKKFSNPDSFKFLNAIIDKYIKL